MIADYNGERKAKPVVEAARALMPSFMLSQKQMKVLGDLGKLTKQSIRRCVVSIKLRQALQITQFIVYKSIVADCL